MKAVISINQFHTTGRYYLYLFFRPGGKLPGFTSTEGGSNEGWGDWKELRSAERAAKELKAQFKAAEIIYDKEPRP